MRFRTSMSVAVCVFAAGLGVAGCSPSDSSSAASGSATTGSGATAQAAAGTSTQQAQQAQGAAGASRCQPKDLSFALGADHQIADADGQWTQVVDMTNHGSSACTMQGYPGVDLIGDVKDQPSYDWSLMRAAGSTPAKVSVAPGSTAHFDLTYLSGDLASGGGDGNTVISVHKMVITPPDDFTQGSLAWAATVVLQDTATSPGTYISTVASGT